MPELLGPLWRIPDRLSQISLSWISHIVLNSLSQIILNIDFMVAKIFKWIGLCGLSRNNASIRCTGGFGAWIGLIVSCLSACSSNSILACFLFLFCLFLFFSYRSPISILCKPAYIFFTIIFNIYVFVCFVVVCFYAPLPKQEKGRAIRSKKKENNLTCSFGRMLFFL